MRDKKEGLSLVLSIAAALVAVVTFGLVLSFAPEFVSAPQPTPTPGGVSIGQYREIPPVVLTDHDGRPFVLASLRGRPVVMLFGYTYCPDVCPMGMVDLRRLKQQLGERGDEVAFLFVSVDPDRDTPDVLRGYVKAFDPSFIGATATDQAQLQRFVYAFDGLYEKQKPTGTDPNLYTVAHTSFTYLLDQEGRWRKKYPFATPVDVIKRDVLALLNEQPLP